MKTREALEQEIERLREEVRNLLSEKYRLEQIARDLYEGRVRAARERSWGTPFRKHH